MTIQEAVLGCQEIKGTFARPASWKGQGKAIDLGKWFDSENTLKITSLREEATFGTVWNPQPGELVEDWELVAVEDLARETGQATG